MKRPWVLALAAGVIVLPYLAPINFAQRLRAPLRAAAAPVKP